MNGCGIDWEARPRLLRGVRLKFDAVRERWVLLAPERIVTLNLSAVEVLKLCSGDASLAEIVEQLSARFKTPPERIAKDASDLLERLRIRKMVEI